MLLNLSITFYLPVMKYKNQLLVLLTLFTMVSLFQCSKADQDNRGEAGDNAVATSAKPKKSLEAEGKDIFRHDSFGDEVFWSDLLHIDKAILGVANGGFGPGVSPNTALAVGLKVDAEALPPEVVAG